MSTIAELRAAGPRRAEDFYPFCTDLKAMSEYERLETDRDDLLAERESLREGVESEDLDAKPKRNVPRHSKRIKEIDATLVELEAKADALWDHMESSRKDLLLRAIQPHEWRDLLDRHPARDPETTAGRRDAVTAHGLLDSDALMQNIGLFAVSWGDETLGATDWDEVFYPSATPRQLRIISRLIVELHEGVADIPKSRPGWSGTSSNGTS